MYDLDEELLDNYSAQYSRNKSPQQSEISYGTAGFRRKAVELPHIVFRMGLLASVRSQFCRAAIGLMLTASHNPVDDNGVKLIDPHGEMLEISWERYATRVANCNDEALISVLRAVIAEVSAQAEEKTAESDFAQRKPMVLIGRDTRPSCSSLAEAAIAGATCFKAHTTDFGLLTTPMLHYIVRCTNDESRNGRLTAVKLAETASQAEQDCHEALRYELVYGQPDAVGYYQKLASNYVKLLRLFGISKNQRVTLTVDCANGIGYQHLRALQSHIPNELLQINYVNVGDGELNARCGADYVKLERKFPLNVNPSVTDSEPQRFTSLDGDADRIVYFYASPNSPSCNLLDGDKIALLMTRFLARLLREAASQANLVFEGQNSCQKSDSLHEALKVRIGVVQTAYANGSSTSAMLAVGCGVETSCVPTGVKFLHAKATEYDVGVFFEANGHGTVLFSDSLKRRLRDSLRLRYSVEVDRLLTAINLVNEAVGDSLSDLLVIEAILAIESSSVADWDTLYTDLPSRQLKVTVADRTRVRTTYDERRVVEPAQLQSEIDRLVEATHRGTLCDAAADSTARSFVRPSGTEDVVRVYAEAALQSTADTLAQKVADAVRIALA